MPPSPQLSNINLVHEVDCLLKGVFITGEMPLSLLDNTAVAKFLIANKIARDSGIRDFEHTKLLISQACDERSPDLKPDQAHAFFMQLLDYLHLFEELQEMISKLAVLDSMVLDETAVNRLLHGMSLFELLEPLLFEQLFIKELTASAFIGSYGRRKVRMLHEGLKNISKGQLTPAGLLENLFLLDKEQKLLMIVLDKIRDNIRNDYCRFASKNDIEILKKLLLIDMHQQHLPTDGLTDELFTKGIDIIKKESIYFNNLLPVIIKTGNRQLREEFIAESGLDLFYIEEIEREYCNQNHIPSHQLDAVK